MEHIFIQIWNMNLSASFLIAVVFLLRLVFHRTPKWMHCMLWALVAIRLLCPVLPESPFSAYNAIPVLKAENREKEMNETGVNTVPYIPVQNEDAPGGNDSGELPVETDSVVSAADPQTDISSASQSESDTELKHDPGAAVNVDFTKFVPLAARIWIIGMAGLFFYAVYTMWKLKLELQESIREKDNIWLCDRVRSPFILGLFSARIYLNPMTEESQKEYVLAHELAHLKRKDQIWKPFGHLLLCVYWFNPLIWAAYNAFCRDMEMACDELVVKDKDLQWKKEYSTVLLEMSMKRTSVITCPVAFGEEGVKERVKKILNYKKPSLWIILAAIAACVVVIVCFLTNPKKKKGNTSDGFAADGIIHGVSAGSVAEYLSNAQLENSMIVISLYDGTKTDVYYVSDADMKNKIVKSLSEVKADPVSGQTTSISDKPFVGFEIGTERGELSVTWCNDMLVTGDGKFYEFKYNALGLANEAIQGKMPEQSWEEIMFPNQYYFAKESNGWKKEFLNKAKKAQVNKDFVQTKLLSVEQDQVRVSYSAKAKKWGYGEYFSLQVQIDNEWYVLPTQYTTAFNDIGFVLKEGATDEKMYYLAPWGSLPTGTYRIVTEGYLNDVEKEQDVERVDAVVEFTVPADVSGISNSDYVIKDEYTVTENDYVLRGRDNVYSEVIRTDEVQEHK